MKGNLRWKLSQTHDVHHRYARRCPRHPLVGAIVALPDHSTRSLRAQRALRESEERFRLIADRAPVMIWTARPDTTLDYLNRTCAEFTGCRSNSCSKRAGWTLSIRRTWTTACTT